MLLASNHSGSFFDAVVIGSVLSQPIHTLTRGDVFRNPRAAYWLRAINLIPVFRGSEGRENLGKIDTTLDECFAVMKDNGAVVIFSEGVCRNEWNLRPLGKGTARMAYQAWYGDDAKLHALTVLPTGITYEHFRGTGKRAALKFGTPIDARHIQTDPIEYEKWLREFNVLLTERMAATILEVPQGINKTEARQQVERYLSNCPHPKGNAFLNILGKIGRAVHRPIYHLYTKNIGQKTRGTVFYDSALFGAMMYTYPVLIGIIAFIVGAATSWVAGILLFVGMPLMALAGNRYR